MNKAKCKDIVKLQLKEAGRMFFNNEDIFNNTVICFELKSSNTWAWAEYRPVDNFSKISFNYYAAAQFINDFINDTIPHEIAHLVCFIEPRYGKNHNKGWKSVCRQLGGNGKIRSQIKVPQLPGTILYRYVAAKTGKEVLLTPIRHNKLQSGRVYAYNNKMSGRVYRRDFVKKIIK